MTYKENLKNLEGSTRVDDPTRVVKCLMESSLISNWMKMTVKMLLIVMMPTFCKNGGG